MTAFGVAGQVDGNQHVLHERGGAVEHGHHDVERGVFEAGKCGRVLLVAKHTFKQETDFAEGSVVAGHIVDSLKRSFRFRLSPCAVNLPAGRTLNLTVLCYLRILDSARGDDPATNPNAPARGRHGSHIDQPN